MTEETLRLVASTATPPTTVKFCESVTVTEQLPSWLPDVTANVADPLTGVALLAPSCATNGVGVGEA